jgi:hypothetical protein
MDFSLENILVQGYHQTRYEDIGNFPIDQIQFDREKDQVRFPSTIPSDVSAAFDVFVDHIRTLLLESYSTVELLMPHECTEFTSSVAVWDGVDTDSYEWHYDGAEGGDLFVLVYFDSMTDSGAIHFRNCAGDVTIFPQRGDMIFVSNSPAFSHRADRIAGPRRIIHATFDCSMK